MSRLVVAEYTGRATPPPEVDDLALMARETVRALARDAELFGIYAYRVNDDGAIERIPPSRLYYDRMTNTYSLKDGA